MSSIILSIKFDVSGIVIFGDFARPETWTLASFRHLAFICIGMRADVPKQPILFFARLEYV